MDILIGIGGTGSKVVEATLHACAAGLGPQTLHVGFVDQDRGNGNVSRAMTTREVLEKARDAWRTPGNPHLLDGGTLFASSFPLIGGDRWIPHADEGVTLSQILGDLKDDARLASMFFSPGKEPGKEELEMKLDEGYRGRAHIGSAAIAHAVGRPDETFWNEVRNLVRSAKGSGQVRLVLAGSAFGGTGAAGFPTIARLIRRWLGEDGIKSNFRMAGVLMLPYFDFDPPPNDSDNVARSEDLLIQTRSALGYYHELERREPGVFEDLYLVGFDRRANLGYHKPGKGDQRNPALLPELIAALGICDFYRPDHKPRGRPLATSRDTGGAIEWSDLPSPDPADTGKPYRLLGRQLRFAAALKFWGPLFRKEKAVWNKSYEGDPWFRQFGLDQIDYDKAPPVAAMDAADTYFDLLLEWAAAIQFYAADRTEDFAFRLWNVQPLLDGAADYTAPTAPFRLHVALNDAAYRRAFENVMAARVESHALTGVGAVLEALNTRKPTTGSEGVGGIMGALHDASLPVDITAR